MAELVPLAELASSWSASELGVLVNLATYDISFMVAIPASLRVWRCALNPEDRVRRIYRAHVVEGPLYVRLGSSEISDIRTRGYAEIGSAKEVYYRKARGWSLMAEKQIQWGGVMDEVRRRAKEKARKFPDYRITGEGSYREGDWASHESDWASISCIYRFFQLGPDFCENPTSFKVGLGDIWLAREDLAKATLEVPSAQVKQALRPFLNQADVVSDLQYASLKMDREAALKALSFLQDMTGGKCYQGPSISAQGVPIIESADDKGTAGRENESGYRPPVLPSNYIANPPPKWLLCVIAVFVKYYSLSEEGEELSRYKVKMADDLRKVDYWVAGKVFKAENKYEKLANIMTARYPAYVPSGEGGKDGMWGGLKQGAITKLKNDKGCNGLRQSGAYRLAQIWVEHWMERAIWNEDDELISEAVNDAIEQTSLDLKNYFGQGANDQLIADFKP